VKSKRKKPELKSKRKKPELPFTEQQVDEIIANMQPCLRELIEKRIESDGSASYRIKPEYFEEKS
jgi:hypothetical protein